MEASTRARRRRFVASRARGLKRPKPPPRPPLHHHHPNISPLDGTSIAWVQIPGHSYLQRLKPSRSSALQPEACSSSGQTPRARFLEKIALGSPPSRVNSTSPRRRSSRARTHRVTAVIVAPNRSVLVVTLSFVCARAKTTNEKNVTLVFTRGLVVTHTRVRGWTCAALTRDRAHGRTRVFFTPHRARASDAPSSSSSSSRSSSSWTRAAGVGVTFSRRRARVG